MIFNPFMKTMRKISIRGIVALALRGCELLAEKKNLLGGECADALERAWEFTSTEDRDLPDWEASVGDYFDGDFGDSELTEAIRRSLDIGSFHLYGSIDTHGEEQTVYALWDILDTLHRHDIILMDTKKVRRFTPFYGIRHCLRVGEFGWGMPFKRDEILPRIEYNSGFSIRGLIDMRSS